MEFKELTDAQWGKVSNVIPPLPRRQDNRGRPWNDPRQVLDGILWVLTHHTTWPSLPRGEYPPFQTCHRWFQRWMGDGTLELIVRALETEESLVTEDWFQNGNLVSVRRRTRRKPLASIDRSAVPIGYPIK